MGDSLPSPQEKRFAGYMESLGEAAGHADRATPLKLYCTGLLLEGGRKSVEPMAARLAPQDTRRMHQSLHHLVADAPWSEAVLEQVRSYTLQAMRKQGPVAAWIVDDTGFPKKGKHSVGVARQYCGQVGKQENCRVAVSLSVSTLRASLPVAWRLYLPQEEWAEEPARRKQAGVPEEIQFETKPALSLEQIKAAVKQGVPQAPVLADAAYGTETEFRVGITELGLAYVLGIQSTVTVWEAWQTTLARQAAKAVGAASPPVAAR